MRTSIPLRLIFRFVGETERILMEPSLYRYILTHSARGQMMLIALSLASLPVIRGEPDEAIVGEEPTRRGRLGGIDVRHERRSRHRPQQLAT